MKWARYVLPLAVLPATAPLALPGCGSTGASAGDGGASADGTTPAPDAPNEVATADAPVIDDAPLAEASIEAGVEAGDASGGCALPLQVRVAVATNEASLMVGADGTPCTVSAAPGPDAVLTYEDKGTGGGDYPFGEVWVPAGSPWHIAARDGGLVGQGPSFALSYQCTSGTTALQTSLVLTDGTGDVLTLSVGCEASGLEFVVYDVAFTTGSAPGDAAPE